MSLLDEAGHFQSRLLEGEHFTTKNMMSFLANLILESTSLLNWAIQIVFAV